METAGSPLEPPKPEHARKRKIIPEIEFLTHSIENLSSKLSFIKAKLISAGLIYAPHNCSERTPLKPKKYLARKQRQYNNGLNELQEKKKRLILLKEEFRLYFKKS